MKISDIFISNFRCFESVQLKLGQIAVLIGPNNAGKSSILRAISMLQSPAQGRPGDVRSGEKEASVSICCDQLEFLPPIEAGRPRSGQRVRVSIDRSQDTLKIIDDSGVRRHPCPDTEPENCIVPYYSKRKVQGYTEDVRGHYARGTFNMNHLASKLARVTVPTFAGHKAYVEACERILGFTLGAIPSENGLRPGRYLPDNDVLTLDQMGDGVPSIVGLLIELVSAQNKVFLIEEPENDLHPAALKALLELILASASRNQFIVSTHSNIVVQYLGGAPRSIFEVTNVANDIPTSHVVPIEDTSSARTAVLRKLGYALSDFDLWEGWIILEESSAEKIVRDFLVPFFAPRLSSIRFLAAQGVDDAEATYAALHRMVLFTHLEETYRFRTWVRLDGDQAGRKIVERLTATYSKALENQFQCFSAENFEHYYPGVFSEQIQSVLAINDRQERRGAKKQLLDDVIVWLRADERRARDALSASASEVIAFLRNVERILMSNAGIDANWTS